VRQREAESRSQLSRLLPAFSARGIYTRNQYEAVVTLPGAPPLTITPHDQLDAFFVLDVPVIDLAQLARYDASKLQRKLAEASGDLTERQLHERVIRAYFTLLATSALTRSADNSLLASEKNAAVVKDRIAAGVAPNLDLQRALANVERAKQDVADAALSLALARRSLETISRVTPEPATGFLQDDLHQEPPLDAWLRQAKKNLPELRVAATRIEVAEANAKAARNGYLPTLSAQAQERLTNATGFTGKPSIYTLTATLSFRFDLNTVAQNDAADAASDVTRAEAEGTRRSAEDAIFDAWNRTAFNVAKAHAARAELGATNLAAELALDRYGSGAATELDVTQAQRDDFSSDVARIQADLELAQSRAVLRLVSGMPSVDLSPPSNSAERVEP
jgi:outer membrane protein TolC